MPLHESPRRPVHFRALGRTTRATIERGIESLLDSLALTDAEVGDVSVIKINAMSDEVFPGRNTSPWVLEALLHALKARFPHTRFTIADTNVAGSQQFAMACKNWGYSSIAARLGVRVENLAEAPTVAVETGVHALPTIDLPRLVVEASSILNVPVLKTHVLTGITCALKNHWGFLPRIRYQHHPRASEVIAAVNRSLRHTIATIVDGTIAMDGAGPKTGTPRATNVLLAGRDRVAVDAAVLEFMGFPSSVAPHVARAQEHGVGTMRFEIAGDPWAPVKFHLPEKRNDVVSLIEGVVRKTPIVGEIAYAPAIARVLGLIGTQYNKTVWMRAYGHPRLRALLQDPDIVAQYGALIGAETHGRVHA